MQAQLVIKLTYHTSHNIHSQEQAAIFARKDVNYFFQVHVDFAVDIQGGKSRQALLPHGGAKIGFYLSQSTETALSCGGADRHSQEDLYEAVNARKEILWTLEQGVSKFLWNVSWMAAPPVFPQLVLHSQVADVEHRVPPFQQGNVLLLQEVLVFQPFDGWGQQAAHGGDQQFGVIIEPLLKLKSRNFILGKKLY